MRAGARGLSATKFCGEFGHIAQKCSKPDRREHKTEQRKGEKPSKGVAFDVVERVAANEWLVDAENERGGAAPREDACFVVRKPETAELWHRRMGHAGYENLAKMVQDNLVEVVGVKPGVFRALKLGAAPYTAEQNGSAERLYRQLEEKVRAMLEDSGLPKEMWAGAVVTANYTRNRTPVSAHGRTRWEALYGKKPNVGHMRVFWARADRHVPKHRRRKLDPVSERCVFVGCEPSGLQGVQSALGERREDHDLPGRHL
ncbi:5'-3' exoribonuclease 2 [Klebsormidium nitens]|uniref:5'-3' exoribonuclease 2 n=1 Tax=Klebsormidium nitens TaxID=105231 RepID=A0A1Y1IUZ1_KLENI|nr:5'-3' exoribonuclease 2 [Klebsormidium nitens]|eukprot:GAQ92676.1 5'-3' exoribonuclease 2 [Klebsormidium nitens]